MTDDERWLGVDFSGSQAKWTPGCRTSNVWIADVRRISRADELRLHDLRRVQELAGAARPFARLAALLKAGRYRAAAIDAPFSVPAEFVHSSHRRLLQVAASAGSQERDFAIAADFVNSVERDAGMKLHDGRRKPLRLTEDRWNRKVNTRSTMWFGPRGGAAMTSACLTLLHAIQRPLWPWAVEGPGLVAEAFPAAQLNTWDLRCQKYNGAEGADVRGEIVKNLAGRIDLGPYRREVLGNADALDAVLCAFAAIAVTDNHIADPPEGVHDREGWIAVHS